MGIVLCILSFILLGFLGWFLYQNKQLEEANQQLIEEKEQIKKEKNDKYITDNSKEIVTRIENELNLTRENAASYEEELFEAARQKARTYEQDLLQSAIETAQQEYLVQRMAEELKFNAVATELNSKIADAELQLSGIQQQIEDFSKKQEAINNEILRRRELEEKQDFYRVCLDPEDLADIRLLQEISKNLKKPQIIDKIIYDNYVAKPVLEMIKRVLQNETYSGVYKITCLTTNEIYIGKSTDIRSRWQQHCKTAFHCGTIASSLLHTKMEKYGIENFTFEVIEKVPKDQLTEREKFFIDFYKTKECGLNERRG